MSDNNRKNRINLDAISKIDDEIIETATRERFRLLTSVKKKKVLVMKRLIPLLAAAACFCIVLSAVFMLLLGGKEVPVYTGMTVSTTSPVASLDKGGIFDIFSLDNSIYRTLDNSGNAPNIEGNNGNHNGQMKDTENITEPPTEAPTEAPTVAPWDPNASGTKPLFYANKGQDFYITVHIDNPDNFEIVSFTLNGKKYSSYMFEEGSDMENLVLKCNAGEAVNILEYTIDAIKYIDGTTIKDVKIGGEQTIRVGLYSEGIQPTVAIDEEAISYDSISFTANLTDNYGRIADSEGVVTAVLFANEEPLSVQAINVGEPTAVTFEALTPNTSYKFAIIAVYDSLDGSGKKEYVLHEKEFKTDPVLTADTVNVSYHTAGLDFVWHELASENSITAIELYLGEEKVRDIDVSATEIGELLAHNSYTLKISYTNAGINYEKDISFNTKSYVTPEITYTAIEPNETEISFDFEIADPDEVGAISKIELYLGDELIETASGNEIRSFSSLQVLKLYTVKITYLYDARDGKGEQKIEAIADIPTQSAGLEFQNGHVFGIGKCKESKIYIDMPISDYAFDEDETIEEVYLGENATSIGPYAFYNCVSLKAINIPNGVKTISSHAFTYCRSLSSIVIPDGVTSIGYCAFSNSGIRSVSLPDSITTIEEYAFEFCHLTDIIIPNSVKTIKSYAFRGCSDLLYMYIPASVEVIEELGISKDQDINILTDATEIPGGWNGGKVFSDKNVILGVKEIFTDEYGVCYAVTETEKILLRCKSDATAVNIPSGVTRIASKAFWGNHTLTNIILPDTVKRLDCNAFGYMRALKTVFIPNSVEIVSSSLAEDSSPFLSFYIGFDQDEIPEGWVDRWYSGSRVVYNVKSITVDENGNVTNVIYNS